VLIIIHHLNLLSNKFLLKINNILYIYMDQRRCSLCDSSGTNKSTCPLNVTCDNPDYEKHPLAIEIV